jgi:hypothetical protein
VREICTLGLKWRGLETTSDESGASPRPYKKSVIYFTPSGYSSYPTFEPNFFNCW